MRNRFDDIETFLKSIASRVKLDDKDMEKMDIYNELSNYGLSDDEKEREGSLKDIQNELVREFRHKPFVYCMKYEDWLLYREESVDDMIRNGTIKNKQQVKLYIPANEENMQDVARGVFDFMAKNYIVNDSKMSADLRADDLVVRVFSQRDALRISKFVNENLQDKLLLTNPFMVNDGQIGIASDGRLSYNERVATFLADYFKKMHSKGQLENVNLNSFKEYMEKARDEIYSDKATMQNFLNGKNEHYKDETDLRFLCDNKNIMDLMIIALDSEKNIEDFNKKWEEINNTENEKQQIDMIRKVLSWKEGKVVSDKETETKVSKASSSKQTVKSGKNEKLEEKSKKIVQKTNSTKNVAKTSEKEELEYDENGFDSNGIHIETGKKYDTEGYNKEGYDKEGFNRKGYHRSTRLHYNTKGYDRKGFRVGVNYTNPSYGTHKITGTKYDENGFDMYGRDINGYDVEGYDINGWNKEGIHYETRTIYDECGYDRDGYNAEGYGKNYLDREGYNIDGWNKEGINKTTQTKYDEDGYDKDGFNEQGYDREGMTKEDHIKEYYDEQEREERQKEEAERKTREEEYEFASYYEKYDNEGKQEESSSELEALKNAREELKEQLNELKEKEQSAKELLESYERLINEKEQQSNDGQVFGEE